MRKIDEKTGYEIPSKRRTEFQKDELLDIIDFFVQYRAIFDENSAKSLNCSPQKAAHDFTMLLYHYGIMDLNYFENLDEIRAKYEKRHIIDLSDEKLDFNEIMTIFTFIHRAERHAGGWYRDCIKNGTYLNLLKRLEEIKNKLNEGDNHGSMSELRKLG